MIGLNKRDIKKALKAGAKAGGVSLADVRADIDATPYSRRIFLYHYKNDKGIIILNGSWKCFTEL